jgi:hypothetical protein
MDRILTLIPTRGLIYGEVLEALVDAYGELKLTLDMRVVSGLVTSEARNQLSDLFMAGSWEYALWLDDDVVIPPGGLRKLLDLDADISLYHVRNRHGDKQRAVRGSLWKYPDCLRREGGGSPTGRSAWPWSGVGSFMQ